MSTQALCGLSGTITGVAGTEIVSWDITLDVDAVDATSMSSQGHKERIPCIKGGSGTFKCIGTKPNTGVVAATFKGNTADTQTISGDILIDEVGINTPVEGRIEYDASFKFTGAITVNI